ncbi:MAG: ABC transporter permease [Christensenellaceae bacterium]|jgi:ABC-2 type transport system permease protein|nr:ABC transporter permease [Christensenellaceae bacterium]
MRIYFALFKMRLIAGMQYRAAAWAGVVTQFFWGFMYIMIYRAFYASSSAEPPMAWPQLVSYIWLQQAFFSLIFVGRLDGELLSAIPNGLVAYELCRPYDLFSFWYARLLGLRLSAVLLRCLPVLVIAFLLPGDARMAPPAGFWGLSLFALSLLLSLLLVTAIAMFIYILTFVTLSPGGARLLILTGADFLQGSILPIPLMPPWLQRILDFLPFRYVADLPFRLYSGNIAGSEALFQIGVQVLWIAALLFLGQICFRRILGRVVVQGG